MATHSSIVAWRIPWTEELGRPQFVGSQELNTSERLVLTNQLNKGMKAQRAAFFSGLSREGSPGANGCEGT